MLSLRQRGDFNKTEKFLKKSFGRKYVDILEKYGAQGIQALSAATPVDTGLTSVSWQYKIIQNQSEGSVSIVWENINVQNGINIALILDYGHGTRNGGYVRGLKYIDKALEPIFKKMAEAAWKEVTTT